jgi:hypothetical protein
MHQLRRILPLLVLAPVACASGPAIRRLGDYSALQPLFTVPPNEKSPSRITVNLAAPAYVAALYVVPGRGTAVVYPVDSATSNHLGSGQSTIPITFSERPFNRDSLLAVYRRQQQQGSDRRPSAPPRDSARRDSTRRDSSRFGPVRDPNPAASPIGYLVLVASPSTIPYPLLKRRVEGVTIPIDDDEALSTVMKLVKATIADGAPLAGYAQEVERSG